MEINFNSSVFLPDSVMNICIDGKTRATLNIKQSKFITELDDIIASKISKYINYFNKDSIGLNLKKWVPIKLDNEEKIVYIRIDDFFKTTLLGQGKILEKRLRPIIDLPLEERREWLGDRGEAGKVLDGRLDLLYYAHSLEEQALLVTNLFKEVVMDEGTLVDQRPYFHELFNLQLSSATNELIQLKNIGPIDTQYLFVKGGSLANKTLIEGRCGTSLTIQGKCYNNERNQALDNWMKVDVLVKKWAYEKKDIEIEDIQKINELLTTGLENNDEIPGKLRVNGVNISPGPGKKYIIGAYVESEMHLFVNWLRNELLLCNELKSNPVETAGRAFQRLVSIHPFGDANGRTSRFIMDYILMRYNILPPLLKDSNFAVFTNMDAFEKEERHIENVMLKIREGIVATYELFNMDFPFKK